MAEKKQDPLARANQAASAAVTGGTAPVMSDDLTFRTIGSYGLRAYSGWVREEFLPNLVGRQAARTYREMADNSATVGAVLFAIKQSMRQISWRVTPSSDLPEAHAAAEFVESCMDDMSHSWEDFVDEMLTMLQYGFAPHEIVYKRRLGRHPGNGPDGKPLPPSKFDDGRIGIRKLPIRGQDTIIKWFFSPDGGIEGMTQQPWVGQIVDIPIEKLLLFRPQAHKGNPEGRSILRTAYRPWYFMTRLEEQESIMYERFSGFPVLRVPMQLFEAAQSGDQLAIAQINQYKKIVSNIRVDEQMGLLLPSNPYTNPDGTPSNVLQYGFEMVSPSGGRAASSADTAINRYKLDIMTSMLADYLTLGHSARGTQSLAVTKVDLFFQAVEGWVQSAAAVLNTYLIPRLWDLNNMDFEVMPQIEPDMPQRVDLDALSNFVLRLSQAGATLFPDEELENYLRDVAGMPDMMTGEDIEPDQLVPQEGDEPNQDLQKKIAGALAKRMFRHGLMTMTKKHGRVRKAA